MTQFRNEACDQRCALVLTWGTGDRKEENEGKGCKTQNQKEAASNSTVKQALTPLLSEVSSQEGASPLPGPPAL